jgi:hypothetical protein
MPPAIRTPASAPVTSANERDERGKAAATPISRILSAFALALRPARRRDDHSSSPAIAGRVKRPTRRLRTGRPRAPPYLVLLRAGFCLPPTLQPARCALTAPFHHCLRRTRRYATSAVYFLCHCPSGYPARALPGALPSGVRTFLPREALHRRSRGDGLSRRRSSGLAAAYSRRSSWQMQNGRRKVLTV